MSKYEPLSRLLNGQGRAVVRMDFPEIETVLGFKLPKSAKEYEAWWSNNEVGHSHAKAWLGVGWKTKDLNLASKEVTFVRIAAPESSRPTSDRRSDPWGCMTGTVTIAPGTDVAAPSDDEWNAEKGLLLNE